MQLQVDKTERQTGKAGRHTVKLDAQLKLSDVFHRSDGEIEYEALVSQNSPKFRK